MSQGLDHVPYKMQMAVSGMVHVSSAAHRLPRQYGLLGAGSAQQQSFSHSKPNRGMFQSNDRAAGLTQVPPPVDLVDHTSAMSPEVLMPATKRPIWFCNTLLESLLSHCLAALGLLLCRVLNYVRLLECAVGPGHGVTQ